MKKYKLVICLFSAGLLLTSCGNKNKDFELIEVPADIKASMKEEVKINTKTVYEEYPIRAVADRSLKPGKYKIIQNGMRGESQVKLELNYRSGKLISSNPLAEIVSFRALPNIIHYGPLYRDPSPEGKVYSLGYSNPDMEEPDYDKLLADNGLIPLSDTMIAKWNKLQKNRTDKKNNKASQNSDPEYSSVQSESSEISDSLSDSQSSISSEAGSESEKLTSESSVKENSTKKPSRTKNENKPIESFRKKDKDRKDTLPLNDSL